jgi:O-antigen/teichoic acid export membrane protein
MGRNNIALGALLLLLGDYASRMITVVISIVLARSLGVNSYGEYVTIVALGTLSLIPTDLGLQKIILAGDGMRGGMQDFGAALVLRSFVATASIITVYALVTEFGKHIPTTALLSILIAVNLSNLGNLWRALFISARRSEFDAITRIAERLIALVGIVFIASLAVSITTISLALLVSATVDLLLCVRFGRGLTRIRIDSRSRFGALFRRGLPLAAAMGLATTYPAAIALVLRQTGTPADVARFGPAISLLMMVLPAALAFSNSMTPELAAADPARRALLTSDASQVTVCWVR